MLLDARDFVEGEELQADVCIVGAGAAGITLARALSGGSLDIVLLESGGAEMVAATQALAEGDLADGRFVNGFAHDQVIGLDAVRLRLLGGTTNHWAGYCRPLRPVDYERRPHLAVSGWPFGPDELDPWYAQAQEVVRLGPYEYDWRWWRDNRGFPEPVLDDGVVEAAMYQSKYPFSFGEQYRSELEAAVDVRLVLWANAVDLPLVAGGRAVDRVEAAVLDGPRFSVRARVVVLAMGGIENPRLLLSSVADRPAGLGNDNDLVGRHFADHLLVPVGFGVLARPLADFAGYGGIRYPRPGEVEEHGVRSILLLADQVLRDRSLQGIELQLMAGAFADGLPRQDEGAGVTEAAALVQRVEQGPQSLVYFQAEIEPVLDPENRVVLGSATDPLGLRRAEVRWRPRPADIESLEVGLALIAQQIGASGLGRLQLTPGGIQYDPDATGATAADRYQVHLDRDARSLVPDSAVGFHHMGATRMATSPREGVVDADLRVHSVENLFVAGSSSFASPGANTPTLTIVALALRLAAHLQDRVLA